MDWLGKALAETLARQCLDQLPEAHYIIDCDCRMKYWSPAAEQITGYQAGHMVGQWCREGWPPRCDENGKSSCGPDCPARQVMREGHAINLTNLILTHPDQSTSPIDIHIAPLRDDRGSIVGAICTLTRHAA